jgi:hypothetical protein
MEEQLLHMPDMLVTEDVSHPDVSGGAVMEEHDRNMSDMFVTPVVSMLSVAVTTMLEQP